MNQITRWLRHQSVFKIIGVFLMLSPFLNYLLSVGLNPNVPNKTFKLIVLGFFSSTGFDWISRVSNFSVGFLMFRGKNSAWVPVLAILGFAIAKNLITFKQYYQLNQTVTIGTLLINIILFCLVLDAEFQVNKELQAKLAASRKKILAASKIDPKEIVQDLIISKGTLIDFEGYGTFAKVLHCNEEELWLEPTNHLPPNIHRKVVVVESKDHSGQIQLRFNRLQGDSTLVFKVVS